MNVTQNFENSDPFQFYTTRQLFRKSHPVATIEGSLMVFMFFAILYIQVLYKSNLVFSRSRCREIFAKAVPALPSYRAQNVTALYCNSCSQTSEIKSDIKVQGFAVLRFASANDLQAHKKLFIYLPNVSESRPSNIQLGLLIHLSGQLPFVNFGRSQCANY